MYRRPIYSWGKVKLAKKKMTFHLIMIIFTLSQVSRRHSRWRRGAMRMAAVAMLAATAGVASAQTNATHTIRLGVQV